jgi:hypothetical protein
MRELLWRLAAIDEICAIGPTTVQMEESTMPRALLFRTVVLVTLAAPLPALAGALPIGQYFCFDSTQTSSLQTPFSGTCTADSPYAAGVNTGNYGGTGGYFHLETFEDNALNTPGLSAVGGSIATGALVDSIDADDGIIDATSATTAHSFFGTGATGFVFNFNAAALGALPTDVGLVWTDGLGFNKITFTVYSGLNATGLLGTLILDNNGDNSFLRGSNEDRFFGWTDSGGIGSIKITNVASTDLGAGSAGGSGIEIDHVQYGRAGIQSIPEPGPLALMGAVVIAFSVARRRRT